MLFSIIRAASNPLDGIIMAVIYMITIVISLPLHELSHAGVAYFLGDRTAKQAGRLTLNPLKHLDPLGTILLLFAPVGWAKPVPINPNSFKNRKEGMALTAIAGPIANFLLALLSMVLIRFLDVAIVAQNGYGFLNILFYLKTLLYYMAVINIGLGVFNLIPISPLDGSRILMMFLPERIEFWFYQHEGVISMALFAVIFFTNFLSTPLNFLIDNVYTNFEALVNHIPV